MKIVGIDIGTTSICGIVLDGESGRVLRSKTINSNAFLKGCAPWEKIQSPEKIISIAMGILSELLDEHTAAIGVTGQMHGIVYLDREGTAISPLYTWQDERGNQPYKETTYAKYLGSFSGYGNVTDFYNRENGIRPAEAVNYCTIQDYLVMKLCGQKTPCLHTSNGASFGLYDLEKNTFSYEVELEVTGDYKIAGTYQGTPVGLAIGDNQASVFSTLAEQDQVLLNVGTGSQVSIISDSVLHGEDLEVRPYFDNRFLVVGSALCGGRAYSMLKDFYREVLGYIVTVDDEQVYAMMDRMLETMERTSLKVDPRFAGTRREEGRTGSITGITTGNFHPGEFTLGVLEGMAAELYAMYLQMNCRKTGLVGSGNGIRKNKNLMKLAEQMFDMKLRIPLHMEEASYGAALYAGIAAGCWKNSKEAQKCICYVDEER